MGGIVNYQVSMLCQLNLIENAQQVLAFKMKILENLAKGFFKERVAVVNSAGTWNFIEILQLPDAQLID